VHVKLNIPGLEFAQGALFERWPGADELENDVAGVLGRPLVVVFDKRLVEFFKLVFASADLVE